MRERFRIPEHQFERTASFLSGIGLVRSGDERVYNFKKQGISVSIYGNGTVILNCDDALAGKLLYDFFNTLPFDYRDYAMKTVGLELPEKWIGSDEAGKGDYFGPLVVAGVCMESSVAAALYRRGVTDSKKLSAEQLFHMECMVKSTLPASAYEVIVISPERYNQMHDSMGNVLDIMVWAHGRAISSIASRENCAVALVDKFASGRRKDEMENAVKGVRIYQFTKGERETGVATASVLASAQFGHSIEKMTAEYGIPFVKGAGSDARTLAARIRSEKGETFYRKVAKADFTL